MSFRIVNLIRAGTYLAGVKGDLDRPDDVADEFFRRFSRIVPHSKMDLEDDQ